MAEVEVKCCSNPGCDQPGNKSCSACKTTVYCSVICQTADWNQHKEECQGRLLKMGQAHLDKARGFHDERNWVQALRFADLAATKLKKLKDRRLETVKVIGLALGCKFDALSFMGRYRESMECIKECYTLWAMNHMRHPGSIRAALGLIQSCILNEEYEDAEHYARHAMFMINDMTDNFIPSDERPRFLAEASYWLARAILKLAFAGGIPAEEKQKAGEEAIALAREALRIDTQLCGTESGDVARSMRNVADILVFFSNNDDDDDEIFRLHEQSNAITIRVEGSSSLNVAVGEKNLGTAYINRANRAGSVRDLVRELAHLKLALPHYREAVRIYQSLNRMDRAEESLRTIAQIEENIRRIEIIVSATGLAAAAATWV